MNRVGRFFWANVRLTKRLACLQRRKIVNHPSLRPFKHPIRFICSVQMFDLFHFLHPKSHHAALRPAPRPEGAGSTPTGSMLAPRLLTGGNATNVNNPHTPKGGPPSTIFSFSEEHIQFFNTQARLDDVNKISGVKNLFLYCKKA